MNYRPHPLNPSLVIGDNGHSYPSHYTPDSGNWATVEAWAILDALKPDAIPPEIRSYLAGAFAGALWRLKDRRDDDHPHR